MWFYVQRLNMIKTGCRAELLSKRFFPWLLAVVVPPLECAGFDSVSLSRAQQR